MLRHDRTMHLPRIGENDIALDKFGKHELMNRRRRRVNPSQLLSSRNLRWAHRPGNNDLHIDNFFVDAIVICELNNFGLWKLPPQALAEPFRRIPLIKWMTNTNQQLADCRNGRLRHRLI